MKHLVKRLAVAAAVLLVFSAFAPAPAAAGPPRGFVKCQTGALIPLEIPFGTGGVTVGHAVRECVVDEGGRLVEVVFVTAIG